MVGLSSLSSYPSADGETVVCVMWEKAKNRLVWGSGRRSLFSDIFLNNKKPSILADFSFLQDVCQVFFGHYVVPLH